MKEPRAGVSGPAYPDFDPHGNLKGIFIPLGLMCDVRVSMGAKVLYGYLMYHWGSPGKGRTQVCNPGRKHLAAQIQASVPTVERWLAELRRFAYIRTEQSGNRQEAKHFFLLNDHIRNDLKKRTAAPLELMGQELDRPISHDEAETGSPIISEEQPHQICRLHIRKKRNLREI